MADRAYEWDDAHLHTDHPRWRDAWDRIAKLEAEVRALRRAPDGREIAELRRQVEAANERVAQLASRIEQLEGS